MKKIILFIMIFLNISANAGIGDIDKREYVDWTEPKYRKIVYFYTDKYGTCTAQYVAHDIILTARHCITKNKDFDSYEMIGSEFEIRLYNDKKTNAVLEYYGRDFRTDDWALLRIKDSAFHSSNFFNVTDKTEYINIENAGFGFMRILTDTEIRQIKKIFEKVAQEKGMKSQSFNNILNLSTQEMHKEGIKPLYDNTDEIESQEDMDTKKWEFRLKADKTCKLVKTKPINKLIQKIQGVYDNTVAATCDNMGGNSGGAYFYGNNLYAIVSKGVDSFEDKYAKTSAVKTELFSNHIKEMLKNSPNTKNGPATESMNEAVKEIEKEIETQESELAEQTEKIKSMNDEEFFTFLNKVTNYDVLKNNLEKAKERETSLANRTLGALSIGAAGIGGMMALQGMAEKSADEDAERDMRAYLETFQCDYGGGANHQGGETTIELPGGNVLMPLYSEYKNIAMRLRETKEQLGLSAGIESETVFDKADGGLYDNAAMGKTGGGFVSVASALQSPDGEDAAAWGAQKSDAKSKTTTGAIVGGAGILGGAVGNLIINKDTKDDKN